MQQVGVMKIHQQEDSNIQELINSIGQKAVAAARKIAVTDTETKNIALRKAALHLRNNLEQILSANAKDIEEGKKNGLDKALLDRLLLTPERINAIAIGMENISKLDDPVGRVLADWKRDENGLHIKRMAVPLGVIGIIYESRPNVTADAAALCIKSGNAAILRGGSDSYYSSMAIAESIFFGLEEVDLPKDIIQLIPTTDREAVGALLRLSDYVDVIVPRGGKGLCKRVQEESRIPTFQHLDGNCHTYIHTNADLEIAKDVIVNAKLRRTGICGATESLLVDKKIANTALPAIIEALIEKGCEIRGDHHVQQIDERVVAATEEDWATEYLDTIISIKTVDHVMEAIAHVNQYGSHHTDAIITEDQESADLFTKQVDSAIVMVNTSTQFADGGEFGMGAEIGIATGKLHARGPVGVEQLTSFKYIVDSQGKTRPGG